MFHYLQPSLFLVTSKTRQSSQGTQSFGEQDSSSVSVAVRRLFFFQSLRAAKKGGLRRKQFFEYQDRRSKRTCKNEAYGLGRGRPHARERVRSRLGGRRTSHCCRCCRGSCPRRGSGLGNFGHDWSNLVWVFTCLLSPESDSIARNIASEKRAARIDLGLAYTRGRPAPEASGDALNGFSSTQSKPTIIEGVVALAMSPFPRCRDFAGLAVGWRLARQLHAKI
jgi:hypothetical protein